jgi:ketosteroid isomerase-like protein
MSDGNPAVDTALRFVERINAHDVDGLAALMTDRHRFVDAGGAVHTGREQMHEGWSEYFRMVPDYWISVEESFARGAVVVLLGTAGGTYSRDGTVQAENAWSTPAAWRAQVSGGQVEEWRVYADTEPLRLLMEAGAE